jgi:hypothetical protein
MPLDPDAGGLATRRLPWLLLRVLTSGDGAMTLGDSLSSLLPFRDLISAIGRHISRRESTNAMCAKMSTSTTGLRESFRLP